MAQRSHVPKFGTWEGENVEYTAFFETARKGRGVGRGGRIINPNDPEERQELITRELDQLQHAVPSVNLNTKTHPDAAGGLSSTAANKINDGVYGPEQRVLQEKQQHHYRQLAVHASAGRDQHGDHSTNINIAPRNHRERSKLSNSPGFGGEEGYSSSSSSAHSHQAAQPQGKNSTRVRQSRCDYPPAAASPRHPTPPRKKNNNLQAETQQHRRAASVPRFGAWDAASPEAGAGFTVIFDRVKEERQQAANKVPSPAPVPVTSPPAPYSSHQEQMSDRKGPAKSNKIFCCFLPMVD